MVIAPLDLKIGTPRAMPLLIIDELNGPKVKFNFLGERNVFNRPRQGTGRSFVHRTAHYRAPE
jgi:hypothetical protein